MNPILEQFNRMQASQFAHWMQTSGKLSAPVQPSLLSLTGSSVSARYQFNVKPTDGLLAAVAHDLAALLVEASNASVVAWRKKSLMIEFIGEPMSGEINAESLDDPIDWHQAGDQVVTIIGGNGNGTLVFKALLTVSVAAS